LHSSNTFTTSRQIFFDAALKCFGGFGADDVIEADGVGDGVSSLKGFSSVGLPRDIFHPC
jgi:hypothetical protein